MNAALRIALVGLTFAAAGAAATLPFVLIADNIASTAGRLAPAAGLSAGLCGALVWELMVRGAQGRWRAPVAGAVVGLAAHPIMWGMLTLGVGVGIDVPAGDQVAGVLLSGMFFGLFSMVIYGALTAPLGALTGWLLGRIPGLRGVAPAQVSQVAQ